MADKILITGASGFIGRHLVRAALDAGFDVYAGIRASSSRSSLTDARIKVFPFDMSDPVQLSKDLRAFRSKEGGFTYVVHNAAVNKPHDVEDFVRGNAEFTREFARMLIETQDTMRKFVYMSSLAAIGPGDPTTMAPITERDARNPVTPYGHSKLLAERYLHEIESLPYIILRPTGVYGPGDEKFALRVIGLLRKGIEVILGSSAQRLSFVHVHDVATLTMQACQADIAREDFNVSDGNFYQQKEFSAAIRAAMPGRSVRLRIPANVLLATGYLTFHTGRILKRPVHLSHMKMRELTAINWKVDINKARKLLHYTPEYDLRTGLSHVVSTLQS